MNDNTKDKKHKIANYILCALFILSAVVQINDPDPWLWVFIYLYVAALFLFASLRKFNGFALGIGIGICLTLAIRLVPDFINWVTMGMPNIAAEMKTEEPHIELVREFLGLLLCVGALVYLYIQLKKNNAS